MMVPHAVAVTELVEPELRAIPGLLRTGEPIRVALVRVDNASGISYADIFASSLRFNGKSVAQNGANFRQILAQDPADDAAARQDEERVAGEVIAFRPHVVIEAGGGHRLPGAVERRWPSGERFRPRY